MKLFKTILRVVLVLSLIVISVLAIIQMQSRTCTGIQVIIDYKGEHNILSEKDVIQLIDSAHIKTTSEKLKTIPLESIRKILSNEIYINKINKIYFSGTKLMIDISLREILMHVFPENDSPFFVDQNGIMIPSSPKIKEKLIIVNGKVNDKYSLKKSVTNSKSTLNSIYQIATLILKDPFLKEHFKQIYVNDQKVIELIPANGSLTILFGNEIDADEKLFKIKEIYTHVLPYSADQKYRLIDVRFKNRVIAKKANI
ncbi:MAG TPA: hypothetical protein PLI77_00335 [Bacteroidales bacterium]|nr:hypothetical protein [Bacteroidales bacterium]